MIRMNELTQSEREFLDEVNEINKKYCPDADTSLWNVCKGYLSGKIRSDFLALPEEEIKATLKELNGKDFIEKKTIKKSNDMLF